MRSTDSESGQATVELVALLPLLCLLVAALWQIALAGSAIWFASGAARAAARAKAVGGDPVRAARGALPQRLEGGLQVRAETAGGVAVKVAIPALLGGGVLTTVTTRARFEAQR